MTIYIQFETHLKEIKHLEDLLAALSLDHYVLDYDRQSLLIYKARKGVLEELMISFQLAGIPFSLKEKS